MVRDLNLAKIREELEKERIRVMELLERQAAGREAAGDNPDEEDLADLVSDQERSSFVEEIDEKLLEQVERALERVEAGTYGVCTRCGKEIATERLEALPYAEMCIRCQAIAERNLHQAV